MALYLWDGVLLIRTINGVTGIATSAACCCGGGGDCTKRTGDWQIVVAGVDGDGCDDSPEGQRCVDVNGTYLFTGPPDVVLGEYTAPASKNICGLYGWRLRNGYDSDGVPSGDECDYLLDHGGLDDVAYWGHGFPDETITLSLVTNLDDICHNWPATIDLVPV
jgi:hypothetical protein